MPPTKRRPGSPIEKSRPTRSGYLRPDWFGIAASQCSSGLPFHLAVRGDDREDAFQIGAASEADHGASDLDARVELGDHIVALARPGCFRARRESARAVVGAPSAALAPVEKPRRRAVLHALEHVEDLAHQAATCTSVGAVNSNTCSTRSTVLEVMSST